MRVATFPSSMVLVGILVTGGCAHRCWHLADVPEIKAAHVPGSGAAHAAANKAPGRTPSTSTADEADAEALAKVIEEIQALGDLDPLVQELLIEDLRNTKPALWPAMVQQFRAALAYRRQLEAAEQRADDAPAGEATARLTGHNSSQGSARTPPAQQTTPPLQRALPPAPPPETAIRSEAVPKVAPEAEAADDAASPAEAASQQSTVAHAESSPASASNPPVMRAAYSEAPTPRDDWQGRLAAAIESLEQETGGESHNAEDVQRQIILRMLYMSAARRDESLRPIQGIPPTQQDFWTKQLRGLATYLHGAEGVNDNRRIEEAKRQLSEATEKLGELSTLAVGTLALCSEVSSFGVYRALDERELSPGQEILLYAEVDNFKSQQTAKGYFTALRSSYEILDERGQRVEQHEFATTEDYCKNRRRDFFMRYFVTMPKRITPGTYTLQLTIEDVQARKIGQAAITFRIKAG